MRFQLRRCNACYIYTIRERCRDCGTTALLAHPAKFSPDDKYRRYRLKSRYDQ
ncbi:MAG: RNA-protein complex protein Nop10 [Cenarchaeum sp. SB0665_bin_23]|nr:RNA-protein complex protein Nop10 [Cenarchaeum sp. SB0664_bin_35]MXY61680.1 RNA-protein complex protein Nop10 [Cenarchaeum sp. SB0665_bin_23]MYG32432.1 RNA-protein complex protein Nop10 [Cenarchaeum sp. SB0677_bin_16]